MSRLVAFGCSNTYGIALPDCLHGIDISKPSQYAWPALLARNLDLNLVNLSSQGIGNNEIMMKLLHTNFNSDDTVIILWSYFVRHEFFRYDYNSNGGEKVNPNSSVYRTLIADMDPHTKEWKIDNAIKNYLTIAFTHAYLKQKNIKYHSVFSVPDFELFDIPEWVDTSNVIQIPMKEIRIDIGADGIHMGVKSHELLASKLFTIINQ